MNRHFYISESLEDIAKVESALQEQGLESPQLHVYSKDDRTTEAYKLHDITDFSKRDVIRSGFIGLLIGSAIALILLMAAYSLEWVNSAAGWTPFIFLAIVAVGFSTWEGGLRGIQEPNQEFARFHQALEDGKHIFYVDVEINQESTLNKVISNYPKLSFAGDGSATPGWLVYGQVQFKRFVKAMP